MVGPFKIWRLVWELITSIILCVCPLCLNFFHSCLHVCYIETSPFLIRTSRAILHVSQIPQKKVISVSLVIVPCGWKIATTLKQGRQTFHTEICSRCGFLITQFEGKPNISKNINQFHKPPITENKKKTPSCIVDEIDFEMYHNCSSPECHMSVSCESWWLSCHLANIPNNNSLHTYLLCSSLESRGRRSQERLHVTKMILYDANKSTF